jgi:serine/threonine protein phosphatase PrpC
MKEPLSTYKVNQYKETSIVKSEGNISYRFAYARAGETQAENDIGQDYITFRIHNNSMVFAICDGVSLSFCGELAAKFLGDRLLDWLSSDSLTHRTDLEEIHAELTNHLKELVQDGSKVVRDYEISEDIIGLLRVVLEEKREHGSEATFVCGRIDLPEGEQSEGRLFLSWLGDSRLRIWRDDEEKTELFGDTFHTAQRWSTSRGPVGSEPHVFQIKLDKDEMINRVTLYSDGLVDLDSFSTLPNDDTIQDLINAAGKKPTSDDIAFLDIWWTQSESKSNFEKGMKNFFRGKGGTEIVKINEKVDSIVLSDKELFFLGSLLGLEAVVGLDDPFIGYLVEEIQEEWDSIKPQLLDKGWIIENQEGVHVVDGIKEMIDATGSPQVLRFYYSGGLEVVDQYFYINKDLIVVKQKEASDSSFFQLSTLKDMEEVWSSIQTRLPSNEEILPVETTKIQMKDKLFHTALECVRKKDFRELNRVLTSITNNEVFINSLMNLKGEGQITLMKWMDNEWEVSGKAFLKTEDHDWMIHFIDEEQLRLVTEAPQEITQEFYQILNQVTLS